jgi:hypothetical protein
VVVDHGAGEKDSFLAIHRRKQRPVEFVDIPSLGNMAKSYHREIRGAEDLERAASAQLFIGMMRKIELFIKRFSECFDPVYLEGKPYRAWGS